MILRRRTYEKASPSRDAQKIYIICEGKEREKDYFEFLNAKISGGFNCEDHPMYIKDAIVNSENNYSDTDGYPDLYSTQMHYLGKAILKYAKHELERKLRRVIQR